MESFEAKPPDLAALEVGPMGAALVCSHRSAPLAAKCRGGTFKLPVPRRCLPRQGSLTLCSLRLDLRFVAAAPPDRSDVSGGFLQSACYKDVEALRGHAGCHK
jgi:hypothetical protein